MVIADAGFLQRIWTFLRKGPEAVESKEHDNQAQIKQAAPTSLRRRFIVRSTEDLQSESPHDNDDQHYYYHLLNVTVPLEQDSPAFLAALADGYFPRYRMVLPRRSKILVLDLDETLVHSTSMSSGSGDCDFMVEVLIEKSSCLYYVYKRPYLDHFLETVSNWFHLVIYTASLREYADPVLNWLDRGRQIFRKRLFRPACLEHEGLYLKDLTLVDADLSRVCLLDNSPASFAIHPDNGIPIDGWVSEQNDTALLDFLPFLDALRFVEDVRSILSLRRLC